MPTRQKATACVNIVGPDGTLCLAGDPIPEVWLDDPEFHLESLVASGGATRKKG